MMPPITRRRLFDPLGDFPGVQQGGHERFAQVHEKDLLGHGGHQQPDAG